MVFSNPYLLEENNKEIQIQLQEPQIKEQPIQFSTVRVNRADDLDITLLVDFPLPNNLSVHRENGTVYVNKEKLTISDKPVSVYGSRVYPLENNRARLILEVAELQSVTADTD